MSKPYSIKIFLPGGEPDGLRIIEKSNWSGVGLVVPRSLFGEAKKRRELARTGVYVLVGPPEESGLPRVYIGEGDPIKPRLDQHAANKDFWTSLVAFTSKDENLNKAHVQYLESRLIDLASQAKRCILDNGNNPALPSLSEADMAGIADQIDRVYRDGDYVGSLVTAGDTGRATEYDGAKNEPPFWWRDFWERHRRNTGQSEEEARRELRRLLGPDWSKLSERQIENVLGK